MSFFGYGATGHNSNSNNTGAGSASHQQSTGTTPMDGRPPRLQGDVPTDPVPGASSTRSPTRDYSVNSRDASTISASGFGEKSGLQHLPYQAADDSHHDHGQGRGKEGGGGGGGGGGGSGVMGGHCFHHAPGEHCSLPHLMQPLVTPLNHDVVESVVIRVRDGADVTQKAVFYFWDEWKHFVNRGNVIDLGIGVVIGGAFSDIIDSFVVDILTPPLSLWATGTNLENSFIVLRHGKTLNKKYATFQEAQADGAVTENTGHFLKSCLNFLVIAFFLFWIVKAVHNVRKEKIRPPPKEKTCNWCRESIALEAFRCKFCQSFVKDIPGIEDAGIGMFVTVKRPKQPPPPSQQSLDQKHGDEDATAGAHAASSASLPPSSGSGTPSGVTSSGQNSGKQTASGSDTATTIQ
ncbi:hypothetical protein EC968_008780 [Mortierella alpina]|nr:hypothetical protein EC968_008780 [Mortierella alpina]